MELFAYVIRGVAARARFRSIALPTAENARRCAGCRTHWRDARGNALQTDRYLLSLRDFNTLDLLPELVKAGASSFKIEGRLKDASYVKNVTAAYRRALDEVIAANPELYRRASYGKSEIKFTPGP